MTTRREWRRWLARHHRRAPDVWLVYYKKHSGQPRIPYTHAVEEALCYGWIDSTVVTLDADRFAQRFSPRRPTSNLSDLNRERVRRLIAARRMTKAGLTSIAHAFDPRRDLQPGHRVALAPDIAAALKREPAAWRHFTRFPAPYKRIRIGWIEAARGRPAVFQQRLRYFVRKTARNERFGMEP